MRVQRTLRFDSEWMFHESPFSPLVCPFCPLVRTELEEIGLSGLGEIFGSLYELF